MVKADYERLKELEKRKKRLEEFYREVKSFPYLVLCKTPHKRDKFWEQNDKSKRVSGMPQIIDLPNDIGLIELVMRAISDEGERIEKEFNELLK